MLSALLMFKEMLLRKQVHLIMKGRRKVYRINQLFFIMSLGPSEKKELKSLQGHWDLGLSYFPTQGSSVVLAPFWNSE